MFIILLSFKQHPVFFLVKKIPMQYSTNERFITQEQFCVNITRKMDLKYNLTITKKLEQCCKVADITVMVVIIILTLASTWKCTNENAFSKEKFNTFTRKQARSITV